MDNNGLTLNSDKDKIIKLLIENKYIEIKNVIEQSGTKCGYVSQIPYITKLIMEESCNDLGLDEINRSYISSIIAYGAIYSHRSERIVTDIIKFIEDKKLEINFPIELIHYVKTNSRKKKNNLKDFLKIYINYYVTKAKSKSELNQFKLHGIKKIIIRTSEDIRVCDECKKHEEIVYPVDKVPLLPICWGCRCYYEPQIEGANS